MSVASYVPVAAVEVERTERRSVEAAEPRQRTPGGGGTATSVAPPGKDGLASPLKEAPPKTGSLDAASVVAVRGVPSTDDLDVFSGVPIGRPTVAATPPGLDENVETRSLNLVCYRLGQSCKSYQIQVARWRKDAPDAGVVGVHLAVSGFPLLSATDEAFMLALRRGYEKEICGFWRKRLFSLKSLPLRATPFGILPLLPPGK